MGKNSLFQTIIGLFLGLFLGVGGITMTNQTRPAPIAIIPPAPTATQGPTVTPKPILVYINGAVARAGIYELPPESRLNQLLELAGGLDESAYQQGVNLALILQDGQQIYIRTQDEVAINPQAGVVLGSENEKDEIDSAESAPNTAKININTASKEELEEIPGVGPSTADKILTYREENGLFTFIEDIMNVTGIGEGKFEKMKDIITIGD